MEPETKQEKKIDLYFHISILLKGAFSLLECLAGLLVLFVPVSYFTNILVNFAEGELAENSSSFIATHILSFAQNFALTSSTFLAFYLLSRGLVKLVLVVALLKRQLWAYPSSLIVLALFVLYQFYQLTADFSWFLVALTIFDFIVMWFIWREYQILRRLDV